MTTANDSIDAQATCFGPFRLLAAQRLLFEGERPVRIGSRAFDILTALVERAGEVLGKDELMARAWPQTIVEESNLKIQVSALRRALGDGQDGRRYVMTVPGRGYNFVARVSLQQAPQAPLPPVGIGAHNLPHAVTRMIGREEVVAALVSRLSRQRLVTVVGAGGIGKTTVALAVAERMVPDYQHGVWFVDLAPLSDPRLVVSTVAAVLGVEIGTENPLPDLVSGLKDRRMLLLLDNCEHVIDAVAKLAEAVITRVPRVDMLATSREPLGVPGERVYRLASLGIPEVSANLTAAQAGASPAVQLFVERASAVVEDFALTEENASLVTEICQKLDGLPLAIEFAAPSVAVFGVEALAGHLDDNLPRLRAHRRDLVQRHRTMQAVVDWSYGLLTREEQSFFRALGIFAGGFTAEATAAVGLDPSTGIIAIDLLADLVAKSLVVADVSGANPRFRLLETTRAYAVEKLDESGERERLAHRHAEYYRVLLERAEDEATARPIAGWLAKYAQEIDNLRAALDWSFSSPGQAPIGMALTAAYVPVWMNLSLAAECRERCEQALRRFEADQISNARLRMQLQIGVGNSLLHTLGPSEQAQSILTDALATADTLGDLQKQLRILLILSSVNVFRGEYARGAAEVKRASEIARRIGDMPSILIAERRLGITLLTIGRLNEAQQCFERAIQSALELEDERLPVSRAMARAMLARALWLQGFPDRAYREAQASVDEMRGPDHQLTMCRVLYFGIGRIAPMTGDFGEAENAISTLVELATRVNARFWMTAGQFLRGKLLVQQNAHAEGLAVLRDAFEICRQTGWRISYPEFTGSVALALAGLGKLDEAYAGVTDAIERAGGRADGQQWYVPELLRIKGEILSRQGPEQISAAEICLDQAAAMAREQGALFWELRIALSRCRLGLTLAQGEAGRQELVSIYDRFTEGFDTADLVAAKQLLDDLASASRD